MARGQIEHESEVAREQKEHERELAERQRDLETLLQLSNHLTAWHDDVRRVVNTDHRHRQQAIEDFQRNKKYEGPLYILFALLGTPRTTEYAEVITKARTFKEAALNAKILADAQALTILTEAYNDAIQAISDKAERV